ncbi:hypothetical protein SAMN05216227_103621 [Pseudorhodobacter antarcticus]|jgi:hypothetical protein|uniref:Uncharacterized protein n=1 Tax=Pseudorhodobacter antarcticus TaxID=1077947 RepID=A0A1H8KXP2_9RHOB|nr:hypothetical protein [Pseudorhodobacter antarcticus]SEN97619.1 hypothetical protein SAMN05216227_103621 [Pseudorhodobacter antarcticus]
MGYQTGFHAPHGGADFLGFRKARNGSTEVIYDDGVSRRMIWRVAGAQVNEAHLADALRNAVSALRVVPALIAEVGKRAIALERITV